MNDPVLWWQVYAMLLSAAIVFAVIAVAVHVLQRWKR